MLISRMQILSCGVTYSRLAVKGLGTKLIACLTCHYGCTLVQCRPFRGRSADMCIQSSPTTISSVCKEKACLREISSVWQQVLSILFLAESKSSYIVGGWGTSENHRVAQIKVQIVGSKQQQSILGTKNVHGEVFENDLHQVENTVYMHYMTPSRTVIPQSVYIRRTRFQQAKVQQLYACVRFH